MALRINAIDANFSQQLKKNLSARKNSSAEISNSVKSIISDVEKNGDEALFAYTKKWDNFELTSKNIKFSSEEIAEAVKQTAPEVLAALEMSAKRIEEYSKKQMPTDYEYEDEFGNILGWRWHAITSAGLYIPGGKASYPSSVLMNAVPAKVAGVKRLAAVVPTPEGVCNPAILAACKIAGIDEVYRIGGAQAVAALAYGTQAIAPVDKIVGPGNAYVAEAKRQVFGLVGIDMIAGPSEILVVADEGQNPKYIAADLLSQSEHDEMAQAILITDSKKLADEVEAEIAQILKTLARKEIATKSWDESGLIIIVEKITDAPEIIDKIAPEHLEIITKDAEILSKKIKNAGAIFIGAYTPEAIGDYIAGPSHVLPTNGSARFSSGLSVLDFLKRSSVIFCKKEGFDMIAQSASILADCEGLTAHALSLRLRGGH